MSFRKKWLRAKAHVAAAALIALVWSAPPAHGQGVKGGQPAAILKNLGGMAQGLARFGGLPGGPPVLVLYSVDGRLLNDPKEFGRGNSVKKFKLTLRPAPHSLVVGCTQALYDNVVGTSQTELNVFFVAESDRTYEIECSVTNGKWSPSLVDQTNKASPFVVAASIAAAQKVWEAGSTADGRSIFPPCDVTAGPPDWCSSVHKAARRGDLKNVQFGLDVSVRGSVLNVKDSHGETPLQWAAIGGHKEVAELLLVRGAEVNTKDNNGETPLHWAAGNGYEDLTEVFLVHGAEVNATDNLGNTPLHYAAKLGYRDVADMLRQRGGHE